MNAGTNIANLAASPAPASISATHTPLAAGEMLLPSQVREHFARRSDPSVDLSLVAPVFDEADNLERLYQRIVEVFDQRLCWELVLVDDGSRDRSPDVIRSLAARDPRVVGAFFAKNCGQTAATCAGIQLARGALLATLDADLQNDPADLPAMIEILSGRAAPREAVAGATTERAGYDAVVGYREKRNDTFVRRASSRIANRIRNWISKDSIRDTGCSLKVFRTSAIQSIPLFEGMHRFLPTLLRYHGYAVIEHPVSHHPRTAGKSKYGIGNRAFRALKDLIAVRWMRGRLLRLPIREVTDAR